MRFTYAKPGLRAARLLSTLTRFTNYADLRSMIPLFREKIANAKKISN